MALTTMAIKTNYLIEEEKNLLLDINSGAEAHFSEYHHPSVTVKRVRLPETIEGALIEKLMVKNNSARMYDIQVTCRFVPANTASGPVVYFSPHNEGIMVCGGRSPHLFTGGLGPEGGAVKYYTDSRNNSCSKTVPGDGLFQPLSSGSSEWSLSYNMTLSSFGQANMYNWILTSPSINDIDKMNRNLINVFGKRKEINV